MTPAQMQHQLIDQIDAVLKDFRGLRARYGSDMSRLSHEDAEHVLTRARAAIHRVAARPSAYFDECEDIMQRRWATQYAISALIGVLRSLRSDIEAGYTKSYTELIHGELFADFLDMSQHLLDESYKDAAAVIAGSSLEAHLRQLCQKVGIDTEANTAAGTSPKKADRLNSDLAGANVYSKLDQKNVTAWLDLRNKAAHGHYGQYDKAQVALLILGVRDFIIRNPA